MTNDLCPTICGQRFVDVGQTGQQFVPVIILTNDLWLWASMDNDLWTSTADAVGRTLAIFRVANVWPFSHRVANVWPYSYRVANVWPFAHRVANVWPFAHRVANVWSYSYGVANVWPYSHR